MRFWRLIAIILLLGALYEGSDQELRRVVPTLGPSAYASQMEEALVAVCDHIGQSSCELPTLRNHVGVEWSSSPRNHSLRPSKYLKSELGVRARGSWMAPIAEAYRLTFFAEPRPVERLRVLRRLRI